MTSVPVFDIQGNELDRIEVDEARLGDRVRPSLLRQAVQMYEMNRHVCTKGHLSRGEVKGSTRKMYRQKHTGHSRAGQRTVCQRRGGGLAFPPKTRDIAYHLPKKARKAAARSALLARLRDNEVSVIKEIDIDVPRTRTIAEMLKALDAKGRCLLVVEGDAPHVWKSARNIRKLGVCRAADVNAYELLEPDHVFFTHAAFQQVLEALRS